MVLPLADKVKCQLRSVISSFKFGDIEDEVLSYFPELTWDKLRKSLLKNNLGLTVSGTVKVIEKVIKDRKIPSKELRDRLLNLELRAISRDCTRREWNCYELHGRRTTTGSESIREVQKSIVSSFAINGQEMDVRVTTNDNITFVSVKPQTQHRRAGNATFYAFSNEQNYFFTSRKLIAKDSLIAVTRGLGYTSNKLAKLSGRDLKSLLKLLWAKQQGAINKTGIAKPPGDGDSRPVVRRTGIDSTESKQRGAYVVENFEAVPPLIESLKVTIKNARFKHTESDSGSEDESFDMKVEFYSENISNFIEEAIKRNVITVPLPAYATDTLEKAKNRIRRAHSVP